MAGAHFAPRARARALKYTKGLLGIMGTNNEEGEEIAVGGDGHGDSLLPPPLARCVPSEKSPGRP